MLTGGSEAPVFEPFVGAFAAMRALSTRNDDPEGASRPFDEGRDGFVIAEGAGVLVLEELAHAERRGAHDPGRAVRLRRDRRREPHHVACARRRGRRPRRPPSAAKAGIGPDEIDHISAHATSTPEGRSGRAAGLSDDVRRPRAKVSITATKSSIGHTLGAPAPSARWPPSARCATAASRRRSTCVDPTPSAEGMDCTPLTARSAIGRTGLINAFGFGGQNSALIFRKWSS